MPAETDAQRGDAVRGPNFLIGGTGKDRLVAGRRADVLAAGDVAATAQDAAFQAWLAGDVGATALGRVADDGVTDLLSGLGGLDAFFASGNDRPDRRRGEQVIA